MVPWNYHGAEKFLSLSDVIAIMAIIIPNVLYSIIHYSCVCGGPGINGPSALPIFKNIAHLIMTINDYITGLCIHYSMF